ncbi:MAG: OmpA family protein, partial [Armatimonadetes bacterium]|nr:OmpA family protein [Armatimonadota bacterium]
MWRSESVGRGVLNPFIALADMYMNLLLILCFFVAAVLALSHGFWEQAQYRALQTAFYASVMQELPRSLRPMPYFWRHDPPGAQRWVFWQKRFFVPHTSQLTSEGREAFVRFARVVRKHADKWRRIRIEGHTLPPRPGEPDDWMLSAARAAAVAQIFHSQGHVPAHLLAVAGRAGQTPLSKDAPWNPDNERVEIIIEFVQTGV